MNDREQPRRAPSKALKGRLERYFGRQCIVTGNNSPEWHHLDDDSANTVFPNLVPLDGALNTQLRDIRQRALHERPLLLPPALAPDDLIAKAKIRCDRWNVGCAYGCARLAFFIAQNYCLEKSAERLLGYAGRALYFARHKLQPELLSDILKRDVLPIVRRVESLSTTTFLDLVRPLSAILSEYGMARDALPLTQAIEKGLTRTPLRAQEPENYAALRRRQATLLAAFGGLTSEVRAWLADALDAAPRDDNIKVSCTNTEVWLDIAAGDYSAALDKLEPLYNEYVEACFTPGGDVQPIYVLAWNMAELTCSYSFSLSHVRPGKWKQRLDEAVNRTEALFRKSGAKLFELSPTYTNDMLKNSAREVCAQMLLAHKRPPLSSELRALLRSTFDALKRVIVY